MALCQRVLFYILRSCPTSNTKEKEGKKYNQPSSSFALSSPFFFHYFLHPADLFLLYTIHRIFSSSAQLWLPVCILSSLFFSAFFGLNSLSLLYIFFMLALCIYIYIRDFFVSKPIIANERNAKKG